MRFEAFCLLLPMVQLYWVLKHGTFIAHRHDGQRSLNLYHCADEGRGFFAEVGIDDAQDHFAVLRSFVSAEPLEDYSHFTQLPPELY